MMLTDIKKINKCHNIGTLLLFWRKSIYAILKMLKSI